MVSLKSIWQLLPVEIGTGWMLEISDHTVRNIVSTGAPYITETHWFQKNTDFMKVTRKELCQAHLVFVLLLRELFFLMTLVKKNYILHDYIIRLT